MFPSSNVSLSLILIALGILGVILSFLVPERKKSLISLILACLIILTGIVRVTQDSLSQIQRRRGFRSFQTDRNKVDMKELRNMLKNKADDTRKSLDKPPPK
ncbi:hypothetical protein BVX98_05950 [bacterium F11]|nr:hypothetical protein BVX98_05950 [bacterium F11]